MISHIHRSFELVPGLRRWSYYCFYCLQATLVLLPKVADDYSRARHLRRQRRAGAGSDEPGQRPPLPAPESNTARMEGEDVKFCRMAVAIFEQIKLKASQRCADVVRQFLEKWARPREERAKEQTNSSRPAHASNGDIPSSNEQPPPVALTPSSVAPTTDTAARSVNPSDGSSISTCSPGVSLDGLQAELYGAIYGHGAADGGSLSHNPYFYGIEGFGDGSYAEGNGNVQVFDGEPYPAWFS
jgi:hypothetical protein